jgi:hypothetical protein
VWVRASLRNCALSGEAIAWDRIVKCHGKSLAQRLVRERGGAGEISPASKQIEAGWHMNFDLVYAHLAPWKVTLSIHLEPCRGSMAKPILGEFGQNLISIHRGRAKLQAKISGIHPIWEQDRQMNLTSQHSSRGIHLNAGKSVLRS